MSNIACISEPESELERLIAELSESGQLIFVFGCCLLEYREGWSPSTRHITRFGSLHRRVWRVLRGR